MAKARPLARKAMELAPDLPEPHCTMGLIHAYADWDWETAERDLKRALELDPGFGWAHAQSARLLAETGRFDEALVHFERAHDLDPDAYDAAGTDLGRLLEWMGREDEAVAYWDERIELLPAHYAPYMRKGDHYCRNGRFDEALPLLERAEQLNRLDPWVSSVRGYCLARAGRREEAQAVLDELEEIDRKGYVTPLAFALMQVGLEDRDRAFEALERAYALRSMRLVSIGVDPRFDPIRDDRRFDELLQLFGPDLPTARASAARRAGRS